MNTTSIVCSRLPRPRMTGRRTRFPAIWVPLGPALLGLLAACAPEPAPVADSALAAAPTEAVATAPAPASRTEEVVDVMHAVAVPDPYRWLEDQESAETRAWIAAQNAHTDTVLADLPVRGGLEKRFTELMKIEQVGFPRGAGGRSGDGQNGERRYFFSKRAANQDLFVLYMREGAEGSDEVLIDPHPLAADHSISVTMLDASTDGRMLAYGLREGGQDEVEIRLFDVEARAEMSDLLPRARYQGLEISPDKSVLYYTRLTPEGPRVFRHRVGDAADEDEVIFGAGQGIGRILVAALSDDGRHLLVHVLHGSSGDKADIYLSDLSADPSRGTDFQPVVEGLHAGFFAAFAGDSLVIRTTQDAPNGRILTTTLAQPGREHWHEIVAERAEGVLRSVSPIGGKLFVNYLENVQSRVAIFDLAGRDLGTIAFDTIGSVGSLSGDWGRDEAFFTFSSFHVPSTIFRYDTAGGSRTVWSRLDVPVDSDRFVVEQTWFPSKDGVRVPMFVMRAADTPRDGQRPTYLTGYGGFNVSRTPSFNAAAVAWAERGGVYAVANLRGGGEFGESWHRGGMLENKQNTFNDFIAAAEYLVDAGWTQPAKLAIRGGSNGGLLVAAVANQRPDLFGAVICGYPLLDMLRYHQFMVARYWVPEYGSAEDADQFEVLRAYSPYHNVREGGSYPAMLFVTGDGDTRVAPLHARKMAALLQAKTGSERPILLRYHLKAGHSGGKPISLQIEDNVEAFAFLFWQLGETAPGAQPHDRA